MAALAAKKTVVSVVLLALMLFCLGDLVQAVVPGTAEAAGCDSLFCDEQTGCGTGASFKPITPPMFALMTPVLVATPLVGMLVRQMGESPILDVRPVGPLAPRSPPSA